MRITEECIWTLEGEKLDILGKPRQLNNYRQYIMKIE